jgi:SpoVK/Ycf46/Vps4 family AAA+-type ATPase
VTFDERWERIRESSKEVKDVGKAQLWTALAFYLSRADQTDTTDGHLYEFFEILGMKRRETESRLKKISGLKTLWDEEKDISETDKTKIRRKAISVLLRSHIEELQGTKFLLKNVEINVAEIKEIFGLSNAEASVLQFFTEFHSCVGFHIHHASFSRSLNFSSLGTLLSAITGEDEDEVRKALDPEGLLFKSRLLWKWIPEPFALTDVKVISYVGNALESVYDTQKGPIKEQILSKFFREASQSKLGMADFSHLDEHISSITKYLKTSMEEKRVGVNVLFYGPPGTGKSQLTRVIAQYIGVPLLEITENEHSTKGATAEERLVKYFTTQWVSEKMRSKSLVLFDEVEGVIAEDSLKGEKGKKIPLKGWLNRILETNTKPTFWVSNSVWKMDNATLRRFDYVLEVPIPPAKVRQRILGACTADLSVEQQWVTDLATKNPLTPADMDRAAKLARSIGAENVEVVMENFLKSSLASRYHKFVGVRTDDKGKVRQLLGYDISYLNTDWDMSELIHALRQEGTGARICLYGPPGTGKSEYVYHLGKEVGRRVILKRMSDLQSMWVGQTEKNIAEAFKEALDEDTILLVDEADSLIRDRSLAKNSWEVSQVNEFLTQMEAFSGILICSTNIIDNFDRASMRRFDLKIKFEYLDADQSWEMFQQTVEYVGCGDAAVGEWESRVRNIPNLAPGDFAVVCRQASLRKDFTPKLVYDTLTKEIEVKFDTAMKKVPGFGR